MENLLRRRRHRLQHRFPEILAAEPDDEVRTPEVWEDQAFAQPQRCVRELFHLCLLPRHHRPLLPEPSQRQRIGLLLGHQHGNLHDGRLTLEDGLCRRAPIVVPALGDDRIEFDVLILQCMHELV